MRATHGKIRVGVLRGGPSPEYEISLQTGKNVLAHLPEKYQAKDIFIDKAGVWHTDGIEKSPHVILRHVDVVFNALHGAYGEDGTVQRILEHFHVPFTGSGALASALGMNKHLSKKVYTRHGLRTPHHEILRRDALSHAYLFGVYANLKKPLVVKPASAGSSVGVSIVHDWNMFTSAVEKALEFSDMVIVEEYIEGREATCGVLDSVGRSGHVHALLPIEIIKPQDRSFFDYDAKYSGISQEICPGNFTDTEIRAIEEYAVGAHRALGLRHYSRSDFIITPDHIYILETNSLPGLTSESLIPKALRAADCEFSDFLDHVIILALL